MSPPLRSLFIAFPFAALAAFFLLGATLSAVPVLASPIPASVPISLADFAVPRSLNTSSEPTLANESKTLDEKRQLNNLLRSSLLDSHQSKLAGLPRDDAVANYKMLDTYYTQMSRHSANFQELSSQASTASASDTSFQQRCAYELTGFQNNLGSFQSLLAQMGSDKGLANYEKNDFLETLLKNVVNLNKDMLKAVDIMVYDLPVVGSTLGPIVYEIKCILDEVLDALENLTDAILNAIEPILKPVIDLATSTACNSGLQVLGLCVLL